MRPSVGLRAFYRLGPIRDPRIMPTFWARNRRPSSGPQQLGPTRRAPDLRPEFGRDLRAMQKGSERHKKRGPSTNPLRRKPTPKTAVNALSVARARARLFYTQKSRKGRALQSHSQWALERAPCNAKLPCVNTRTKQKHKSLPKVCRRRPDICECLKETPWQTFGVGCSAIYII